MYQNDTSLDIKGELKKLYNDGKDVTEITEKLINEYKSIMEDSDEAALFWITLADMQWKYGVLYLLLKVKHFIGLMKKIMH